ncbi:ECF transporter S component [Candidatus Bathyarchaeota archaeon]|nr:ECF transporter S component [Candidatus Bathyarchaeota archaeon]
MSSLSTREIAASGIMAALVCVTTMFIQIPVPATEGYFNIGDAMIMVAALTFGPVVGAIAGGIGSSLADLISGWYNYAPFTLIVKGVEGLIAGWILRRSERQSFSWILLAWLLGESEMVVGYFIVEAFIMKYGFAALAEVPINLAQMAVGGIVGIPISLALKKRMV